MTTDSTSDDPTLGSDEPGIATDHLRENLTRKMFGEDAGAPLEIGRYAVVERVGAGASGVVFKAFDDELERMVAIKVLPRPTTADERLRELALREGRALAKLSHPHVVGIHEVGEHRGSLYFVMEFVRGGDLARWLAAQDPTQPQHADRALALVLEAGRGLWAAHQAGIVHRDFKPANVLVAQDGHAKVADFGLARADVEPFESSASGRTLEASASGHSTEQGVLAGTRAYMAPERLSEAPASERTDQFAFCVSAWEVLHGERPWPGRPWQTGAPPTPRPGARVDPKVRRALERGLARDPDARWPSMGALLGELGPKPSSGSAALSLGVLTVGIGGAVAFSTLQPQERCTGAPERMAAVWSPQRAAAIAREIEALRLPFAQDAWQRFATEVDTYAALWVDMYTDTCEATVVRKEQSEPVMELRMSCLRRARQALASTLRALEQPDRETMMRTHLLLDGLPSLQACEDVDRLRAEVPPPPAADEASVDEARARLADVRAFITAAQLDEARAALEDAAHAIASVDYPPVAGELEQERGRLAIRTGDAEAAIEHLRRALASATRDDRTLFSLDAVTALCEASINAAKHGDAQIYVDLLGALAQRPHAPPHYRVHALDRAGAVARGEGRTQDAIALFEESVQVATEVLGPDHALIALPLSNLGMSLYDAGRYQEASDAFDDVLEIRVRERGPEHPSVGLSLNQLCTLRVALADPHGALPHCERALEILTASLPAHHQDIAMVETNFANALFKSGRQEEGIDMARAAVRSWIASDGPDHPSTSAGRRALGHKLAEAGHLQEAQRELEAALDVFESSLGAEHMRVAQTKTSLATLRFMDGDFEGALRLYEDNRPLVVSTMGEDHPFFAVAELGRGEALAKLGRTDEARAAMQTALEVRIARYGEDSNHVAAVREALAKL
ncbi:MAG: tetratricopeptide repeat protein [Nannocystaceae bacterium]|nr:serine/threonine-protein kinase [bacterium]